jgi:predicted ATP-grasp superfamily ATP-dependent carboligase
VRLFLYEFVTGGGVHGLAEAGPPAGSLLAEGQAMVAALAADFAALPGCEVFALRDARLEGFTLPGCRVFDVPSARDEQSLLIELAPACDATILIAPEFDGLLLARCRAVSTAGGRLLSPGPDFVAAASDKHRTAGHLAAGGVPVPFGITLGPGEPPPAGFPFPAVLKPRDGAGSIGVRLVEDAGEVVRALRLGASLDLAKTGWRLERFCPGIAASVAFLCGPAGRMALPPCRQHLSEDGTFTYLGGELPLPAELARRAVSLAETALAAMPLAKGYVGVDLVLGEAADGGQDVVIEINPRLTTSYVGLRASTRSSLAAAMLAVAAGCRAEIPFERHPTRFTADGRIERPADREASNSAVV